MYIGTFIVCRPNKNQLQTYQKCVVASKSCLISMTYATILLSKQCLCLEAGLIGSRWDSRSDLFDRSYPLCHLSSPEDLITTKYWVVQCYVFTISRYSARTQRRTFPNFSSLPFQKTKSKLCGTWDVANDRLTTHGTSQNLFGYCYDENGKSKSCEAKSVFLNVAVDSDNDLTRQYGLHLVS